MACMADGPEGYVSGLVWESPATEVPEDAQTLKVYVERPIMGTWMGFVVRVIDGPEYMVGHEFGVVPEHLNSCVGLGVREGYLVVYRELVDVAIEGETHSFLQAIDYLPSERNERERRRRGSQWMEPGVPAEALGF